MKWLALLAASAIACACDEPRRELPQRKDTRYCKRERVVPCDGQTNVTCLECAEWGTR